MRYKSEDLQRFSRHPIQAPWAEHTICSHLSDRRLTTTCTGAAAAQFSWILSMPLARPVMCGVRRLRDDRRGVKDRTDYWYDSVGITARARGGV